MTGENVYITRLSAWAPGIADSAEWDEWALGRKDISRDEKGPEISFTDALFRRRLSQISRMTIQVIHDLLPVGENTKIFFLSFRGELSRQFQINKMLIEEKTVSPASFSLSVFNAPAALATMAMQLKGGYTAIFPGNDSFTCGLNATQASLYCSGAQEVVFVYADEQAPKEYSSAADERITPLAFALLLSQKEHPESVSLSPLLKENDSPREFLKRLLLGGGIHVSP